jgi:rfaE bifunctional protein kinase chain/domain
LSASEASRRSAAAVTGATVEDTPGALRPPGGPVQGASQGGRDRGAASGGGPGRPLPDPTSPFRDVTVLVVGDVMLDQYIRGAVNRISPEAPVPVVEVWDGDRGEQFCLGGAANVSRNIAALGGHAVLASVVGGSSAAAQEAAGRIAEACADPRDDEGRPLAGRIECELEADPGRPTTVKTRIVAHEQHVVRFDRESRAPIPTAIEARLATRVTAWLAGGRPRARVLLVSDYAKGVVTPGLFAHLAQAARRAGVPVVLDPKGSGFAFYRGARVMTPNKKEAFEAVDAGTAATGDLDRVAAAMRARFETEAVLVTRGAEGMSLYDGDRPRVDIRATARQVYDVTGAGDTVAAAIALALGAGVPLPEAARIANAAAGVVVGKLGTAAVTPAELRAALGVAP